MSCRSRMRLLIGGALALAIAGTATLAVRAELPEWARAIDTGSRFHDAIFRTVTMPGSADAVEVRRSPSDAYDALTLMAPVAPDGERLALRARAAEEKLDAAAAEADWIAFSRASNDRVAGQIALADFYHRRMQPQKEADALAAAAREPDTAADRLRPTAERRAWKTFDRLFALIDAQQLPDAFADAQRRARIARFPGEERAHLDLFEFLLSRGRVADAVAALEAFARAFPDDEPALLRARAELAAGRGADADAIAVYDQAFRPLWDRRLLESYFGLLTRTNGLREFLDKARADAAARPQDIAPAARIFHYYVHGGNIAAAEQALSEFERRREGAVRTADELFTLAQLYEQTRNENEALRYYAAAYSLPGATPADAERALARIVETLFAQPEQPLRLGSGDLSFYRDVATIDRGPGFLNGILSLLFNSTSPQGELQREQMRAGSYFRRAKASDLLAAFERRFPQSTRRPALNATLIATYAGYGESDAVIDRGRRFLAAYADAPQRRDVSLHMADAFARKDQVAEEFATYDRLLQELAERADHVPLGQAGAAQAAENARPAPSRSPEYARVLDRYVARLVSRRQLPDAFGVYRREIDRNPDDPGLYAAAAQFLEQNNFAAETEQVYRLAIQQFSDTSWHHRLARWYLRRRQTAAFDELTRDVTGTFAGTALARYFSDVVHPGPGVNAALFLQLNLYAHDRFPHELTFVRNLLTAYATQGTRDPAAYEALLRRHWFEDDLLGNEFFSMLSRTNRLDAEIARARGASPGFTAGNWGAAARENPVAARFVAEADIWRSRFEPATPVLTALAAEFSGDVLLGRRAASLHRSLSYGDAREVDAAVSVEERVERFDPRDVSTITRIGEIYADRDRFDRARQQWDRLVQVEPGNASGYLEAATVFWDYFQYDDALRMLTQARAALRNPALYAYEAGAIREGLRQPDRAVDEYVRGALAGGPQARARLLALARRDAFRDPVERASAAALSGEPASESALGLRISILEAQGRRPDLERLLDAQLDRASSLERMAFVGAEAERLGFDALKTRSLTRQIDAMSDPVNKLMLRTQLADLYESRGDLDAARRTIEALYADQPKILGIVRRTVDYYSRHGLGREAVDVLVRAARDAYPALRKQFTFEAATRAVQFGDYARGRELLAPLLAEDAFNADYLATIAESYARAKQDDALRDFYRTTIEAMRQAPLGEEERTRRVAALRRSLIPALTRLNDFAGAVDQYIEIVNRFPDDEGLLKEAGQYARRHGRADQLEAYYAKTAAGSPRDYRWPMVIARLETQFEDFPAAINAYTAASAIRPDRADLVIARAALEERLMRFDAAVDSYTKTYELTYHDRQWMERIAELRARQGRADEAAKAISAAVIEGRPEAPDIYFEAARRLAGWHMLDAARSFADRGASLADARDLLTRGGVWVEVETRLRHADTAFDRLYASGSSPDVGWGLARPRMLELANVVARDYTPEEKARFAAFLEPKLTAGAAEVLVDVAERAGLEDLAARSRILLMQGGGYEPFERHLGRLATLQNDRLRFAELAASLEPFFAREESIGLRARGEAADAYRAAGDGANELRVLSGIPIRMLGSRLSRLFERLLERDPQRVVALAGTAQPAAIRDAAANYLVGHGTYEQALAGVRARGEGLPAVWTSAYTALVGLHFGRYEAATTAAFATALGPRTVEAAMQPVDRRVRLAGDAWFAYGSRFGEYLTYARLPGADDYLEAAIERTPARSDAYVTLADFYRDQGAAAPALAEYDHASALNARRSDVPLRAAALLWRQGRRDAAIERWRRALELLAVQPRAGADTAPMTAALDSIGSRKLLGDLHDPADAMVRRYLALNGAYRADALLRSAFRAESDQNAAAGWLIDLARAAPNQVEMLAAIANASWLPTPLRDRFHERIVAVAQEEVARRFGVARAAAQSDLDTRRLDRITALVAAREFARAGELFAALPEETKRARPDDAVGLELRIAAGTGTLGAVLDRYARDDSTDRRLNVLTAAAASLRRAGDPASARRVAEFVYVRRLDANDLSAPVFLGLAEIRFQQGAVTEALDLLRRLTLVVGEPFEELPAAGALLERMNRAADAVEFRRARAHAVPWDAAAQIALARIELASDRSDAIARLERVADSTSTPYRTRVDAARALASASAPLARAPRTELDILRAPADQLPANVDKPFFVAARAAAAARSADAETKVRLLGDAVAVDPADRALRLPLFRAQLAAGRPAQAILVVASLVRGDRTLTRLGLSAAERSRFARELAGAYDRTGNPGEARRLFVLAQEGQNATERAALRQRVAAMDDEIARVARNHARQPRIAESVDQPQLVRPRVPARRPAAASGVPR